MCNILYLKMLTEEENKDAFHMYLIYEGVMNEFTGKIFGGVS